MSDAVSVVVSIQCGGVRQARQTIRAGLCEPSMESRGGMRSRYPFRHPLRATWGDTPIGKLRRRRSVSPAQPSRCRRWVTHIPNGVQGSRVQISPSRLSRKRSGSYLRAGPFCFPVATTLRTPY
jgi:hypothetical protein